MRRSILALASATIVATLAVAITSRNPSPSKPRTEPTRHATVEPDIANSFVAAPWTLPNRFRPEEPPGPTTDSIPTPVIEETTPASEENDPVVPRTRPPRKAGAPAGISLPAPRTSGSETEFLADAVFRKLDANGDGMLTRDEIPTAFRGEVNERGEIDSATFAKLFQTTVQKSIANQTIAVVAMAPPGGSTPTAFPAWFQTLDTDRDGQVSLFEWRAGGRSVAEFQQMDADGDGLLTRREVQTFVAQQKVSPPTAAAHTGPSTTDAAHPAPNAAKTSPGDTKPATPPSRADSLLTYYVTIASAAAPKSRPLVASAAPAPAKPAPAPPSPAKPAAPAAKPAPAQPSGTESATLPLPFTSNPYWVMRNDQNLKALSTGTHPSVLFLGDSITDYLQNGVGNPLWSTYFAPLPALDFAIGGIRTSHVLYQVETGQVLLAKPKVVVLLIGSNNLGIANQKPEEVAEGIEKIVDEIGAQLPNTRILLLGLLPRGASAKDAFRPKIAKVNRLIAGLADGKQVRYLDIGSFFLASDGSITPEIMPDGCHPSLLGYMIYTLAIWPTLTDMLKP